MTTQRCAPLCIAALVFGSFTQIGRAADKPAADKAPAKRAVEAPAADLAGSPPSARVVTYADQDVIAVKTKVRYTTLIILPKTEQILDFTCGDKEFWVVNGNQNFAY